MPVCIYLYENFATYFIDAIGAVERDNGNQHVDNANSLESQPDTGAFMMVDVNGAN